MSRDSLPRWRAQIDTDALPRYSTRAVKAAERILYDTYERGDDEMALKAVTRLTQAVQTHLKALEAAELEERVRALEDALSRQNGRHAYN
ncbi:MAG: hypothetical protein GVY12_03325 [Bacteroidetes bacterium]|jgi:hypothetical protein|nr:hypothetical protein [Bacteroidota bacterium]